jgi:septal ring factor EnvC (AmiA/AmiB activator)
MRIKILLSRIRIAVVTAIAYVLLTAAFTQTAYAESLAQLKREIEAAEKEIKKLSSGKANLAKTVTLTEDKLAKEKQAIVIINREISANLKEVDNLRSGIEDAVKKREENSEKARLLIAFWADNAGSLTTRVFLSGEAGNSVKNAELTEQLNLRIWETVKKYEQQEREWAAKSEELLQKNDFLQKQRTEAEAARAGYAKDLEALKTRMSALKNNETARREYLSELEKRNQRLAGLTRSSGSGGGAFAKLKGALGYPIKGKVIERYGARVHPDTGLSITQYGIKIRPTALGDVVCVADGKVVYVNNLSGWQNIIIIEHDKNYFTVYGNIDEFFVKQNEAVKSRALIGRLDTSIAGAYLYFEIRNHRDAVDPMAWFAK